MGALLLSDPQTSRIGASGAVYGLFLATILIAASAASPRSCRRSAWLVLNLVFTFSVSGISIGGHLGGLVGGFLGGMLVVFAERRMAGRETLPVELASMAALGVVCFVAAIVVATAGIGF